MSVAVQPGFDANDPDNMTAVAGNNGGDIFVSDDGGATWGAAQAVGGKGGADEYLRGGKG